MKKQVALSPVRINRLRAQGYERLTDEEISALAFGNRLPYQMCTALLVVGVSTANIPILFMVFSLAFLGLSLFYHPFDYFYNYLLAPMMKKPKLPKRSMQLKFSCLLVVFCLAVTIFLFSIDLNFAAYLSGIVVIAAAFTASVTDYCISSVIYNAIFMSKKF